MSLLGLAKFSKLEGARDDDWADRASHLYTVLLLCIFAALVSSAQYVGDPIHCWCPAQFPSFHVSYTKNLCWVKNTYYIPMEEGIPKEIHKRYDGEITYYQWVPIIFLFMALLFKLPNVIWRMGQGASGLNMEKVVKMAENTQQPGSPEERDKTIAHIAVYMDRWLTTYRHYKFNLMVRIRQKVSGIFCFWLSKRDGAFLIGFYLFVKLIYCINVVVQFFLLNAFLAMDYNVFGFEILDRLLRGEDPAANHRFPRVTLCDFLIRQMTNRYTVQCVLPINLFNEKIFIVIWFWLFLLACVSFFNYAHWLYYVLLRHNRIGYVKKYLKLAQELNTAADIRLVRKFALEYLRDDGVFVLRVVACNSTEMVLKDLVVQLWRNFKRVHANEGALDRRPTTDLNGDLSLEDKREGTDRV